MESEIKTGSINSLWLGNIYENIKNLENMERIARQGCTDIFEYFQTPEKERLICYADTQYKNLRFMLTEMDLLLTDLTPILEQDENKKKIANKFREQIKKVGEVIDKRKLFVKESKNVNGMIKSSRTTDFFIETLNFISELKREIFKNIKDILYLKTSVGW